MSSRIHTCAWRILFRFLLFSAHNKYDCDFQKQLNAALLARRRRPEATDIHMDGRTDKFAWQIKLNFNSNSLTLVISVVIFPSRAVRTPIKLASTHIQFATFIFFFIMCHFPLDVKFGWPCRATANESVQVSHTPGSMFNRLDVLHSPCERLLTSTSVRKLSLFIPF